MLDMLGAERKNHDVESLAAQCMRDLDTSGDCKVSKGNLLNEILCLTSSFYCKFNLQCICLV